MKMCMNNKKRPKLGYGQVQAKTYERDRRSTFADILFWEREKQELFYAIHASKFPFYDILDAGCGTGRFMSDLAEKGYTIHGVDVSQYMLAVAHEKMAKRSHYCNLYRADVSHLPFRDNTFDFVYCIRVINQLPSKEYAIHALRELCRVCKNPGSILIEYVNEWGLSRFSRIPSTYFSIRDIRKTLSQQRDCKISYVHGILFFSQSILNDLPREILRCFVKLDAFFCKFFAELSTRCYVYMCKQERKK